MKIKTLSIGLVVAVMLSVSTAVAQEVIWDETPQVDVDYYVSYSAIIDEGELLTVSVRTDGHAVDLFLMDSADFGDYQAFMNEQKTSFYYYSTSASRLNIIN